MAVLGAIVPMAAGLKAVASLMRRAVNPRTQSFGAVLENTLGQQLVQRDDADGNGALSVQEFAGNAKAFRYFDRDGNGLVSASEIDKGVSDLRSEQRIRSAVANSLRLGDADHDGVLTATEMGLTRSDFARVDTNNDHTVDATELTRVYARKLG